MPKARTKNAIRREQKRADQIQLHRPPVMSLTRTPPLGFPSRMVARVRYSSTDALTITTGSLAKQVFRWNSTFDPDYTNTGHQPLFRDTFAAIYDHYAVVSARATIKFVNTDTDSIMLVGCVTDDDATSSTSTDVLREQATGQHTILPPLAGSLSSKTFNASWDCMRVLGIDPYTSEEYKTPVGSNPTEESYLHIWATNFDASSTTITVDTEITYTVVWTELTTASVS